MVIIKLKGGLGNIMFQYAFGRKISLTHNVKVTYDISSYKTNHLGDYSFALEKFNINIKDNLADNKTIKKLERFREKPGYRWLWYNFLVSDRKKYITTKLFNFDPSILSINVSKDDAYFDGWWQTAKYFHDIRDVLLRDFTVREPLTGKNKDVSFAITTQNSVSVHIRRADYVNNPKTKFIHGELPKEYYLRAISHITSQVGPVSIFVFSDDMHWVKENILFPYPTQYIDWNMDTPHEDVRLMSLCKHNIIANSTLGWWGAWLNQNPNKMVVGPKVWFANAPQCNTEDILPKDWLRL